MKHPNAFASAVTTGLAALIVYVAHRFGYAHLTTEQAIGAAGGSVTVVLFLGKRIWERGLFGIIGQILHGPPAKKD